MKREKLSELFRKDYVQTIIMVMITIAIVIGFWYGLRYTFKTENPLLAVSSGSMRPTLQVGDLILVQGGLNASKITAAPKPEGDILVFRMSNKLIVHRAIDKENRNGTWYFQTKGDNNSAPDQTNPDQWLPEKNVVGKVVGQAPWLGHIALFFEPIEVKIAFILLWILLLAILELVPLIRKQITDGQPSS